MSVPTSVSTAKTDIPAFLKKFYTTNPNGIYNNPSYTVYLQLGNEPYRYEHSLFDAITITNREYPNLYATMYRPHRDVTEEQIKEAFKIFITFLINNNTLQYKITRDFKKDREATIRLDRLKDKIFNPTEYDNHPIVKQIMKEVLVDTNGTPLVYKPSRNLVFARIPPTFVPSKSTSSSGGARQTKRRVLRKKSKTRCRR